MRDPPKFRYIPEIRPLDAVEFMESLEKRGEGFSYLGVNEGDTWEPPKEPTMLRTYALPPNRLDSVPPYAPQDKEVAPNRHPWKKDPRRKLPKPARKRRKKTIIRTPVPGKPKRFSDELCKKQIYRLELKATRLEDDYHQASAAKNLDLMEEIYGMYLRCCERLRLYRNELGL